MPQTAMRSPQIMKNSLRNALMLTAGLSCLCVLTPQTHAEPKEAAALKHKRKEGPAPTAATLVADMKKSVAFIAKSAKEKISTKSKEAIPFWGALKDTSKALDTMEAGVKAGDGSIIAGLDQLGISIHQLAASWGVLRTSDEGSQVGRGVIALSKAYDVFLLHYGPSVARKHLGGEVSAEEKTQLAAARAEVAHLKGQFASVQGKVKPKTYQHRFINDTLGLCKEIEGIQGDSLKEYSAYIYQYNRLMYTALAYNTLIDVWYPETAKQLGSAPRSGKRPTLAFEKSCGGYYKGWKYTTIPVTHYDDYYEVTYAVTSITETELSTYESYSESYSEESATEEVSEEESAINEEVETDEDDGGTFADEVGEGEDDEDGDGVSDEEDTDDDNDGSADEADNDDDNDGVMDSEDADEDEGADEGDDGDSDDDGSADDAGGDDGGGEEE